MTQICNDLIEAYKGVHEDELMGSVVDTETAIEMIKSDSPKKRLEIYLQWNGILGYTNRIWEISQGEINVA